MNSGVEVDMTDEANNTDKPSGSDTLPDGFSYNPKGPENHDSIVVTPRD